MARVKISEYAAKKLLIDNSYQGVSVSSLSDLVNLKLADGRYVVKVDDGTKKRNQNNLIKINREVSRAVADAKDFLKQGYSRILIEPYIPHNESQEKYISANLNREGVEIICSEHGGVNVEDNKSITKVTVCRGDFFDNTFPKLDECSPVLLQKILSAMFSYGFSFVEINPYVDTEKETLMLDAAVEIDSTRLYALPDWIFSHVQKEHELFEEERVVSLLSEQSKSSFALKVFDSNASIFTLLSGGGASLVVLDTLVDAGLQESIGNYGEYSGAPSQHETRLYTNAILQLLLKSKAPKKVLIIAGGVANFTDIRITFSGVVDALLENVAALKKQNILFKVRRGGPGQVEGLSLIKDFFTEHNLNAIVSDPSEPLSVVADDAKKFIEKTK